MLSVVITVFNRSWCVERAVASALEILDFHKNEIIIVDDNSSDESVGVVNSIISKYSVYSGRIKLIRLSKNQGVCGAKNTGFQAAKNDWVMFLDSDDEFFSDKIKEVFDCIARNLQSPVIFFRSQSEDNSLLDDGHFEESRDYIKLIHNGTSGECLPIVNAEKFRTVLYDADLRGHEGLAYVKLAKLFGPVVISSVIARKYYTSHSDRISSVQFSKRRSFNLCVGYVRMLKFVWEKSPFLTKFYLMMKIVYHYGRSIC